MNFTDFKPDLSKKFNISQRLSWYILSFIQKKMYERLLFGEEIRFRNIGSFKLRIRKGRPFLNLQTNKMEVSKTSYYLDFKPTVKMAEALKRKTVYDGEKVL